MSKIITKINEKIKLDTKESTYQIIAFGIFGVTAYPLFFIFNHFFSNHVYDNLMLRIIATILCLLLAFNYYWPSKLQRFLPIFWHASLLFCLPFFFSFLLLQNNFSSTWLMNYITVLFLMMLLTEWKTFFVLLFTGIAISWFTFELTADKPIMIVQTYVSQVDIIGTLVITVIMGMIFIKGRKRYLSEKIVALRVGAGNIAHDLRTPLASIAAIASGIDKMLPPLIDGYEKAKNAGFDVKQIRKGKIDLLKQAVKREMSEVHFANHYINLILGNLAHEEIQTENYEYLFLNNTVESAVQTYPYTDHEYELVHLNFGEDFIVLGDEFYIKNIIYNLIKNALYFIKEANKGEIFIWTESSNTHNLIYFKDTAKGAPSDVCKSMFGAYYSKRNGGTGLGLAFCKAIMSSFGGDITAEAVEGEYMLFKLTFPRPSEKELLATA